MSVEHVRLRQAESQRRTIQEIDLGGVRVRLMATYSALTDRWCLSIFDTADRLIVGSIACVAGIDLLAPYKHLAIPQGRLFCYAADREPPTFTTLDASARVLYRGDS